MKNDDLGIVQKTGEKDLQTLADRTANDCIVGSLKKVFDLFAPKTSSFS
jgi:fructose-1,6-bisphosphatase/inositol monophosphatase family enzyme